MSDLQEIRGLANARSSGAAGRCQEADAERQAARRARLLLAANLPRVRRARRRRDTSGAVARNADIVVTMVPKGVRLEEQPILGAASGHVD